MKKEPTRSLLDLIKDKLQADFNEDRFDPPQWNGTPGRHEPTVTPEKTPSRASQEPLYQITPNDFSGYQFQLSPPPMFRAELEKKTLYLECHNEHLICTISDANYVISQSLINIEELRNVGFKITIPLQTSEMEVVAPYVLIIHKLNSIKREKENLAEKTQDKMQDNYLQNYIREAKSQLGQLSYAMNQLRRINTSSSNDLMQKFEALEKDLADTMELIFNVDVSKIVHGLVENRRGLYTQMDINTAGVNIISEKIRDLTENVTAFEEELFNHLEENQSRAQENVAHKLPKWTQRDDSPSDSSYASLDEDDNKDFNP